MSRKEPALELAGVTCGYDGRAVVHEAALSLAPGEFVGLAGPNGCGKTTLLRAASGVLPPRVGAVRLFGRDLYRDLAPRDVAKALAVVSQDLPVDFSFTIEEVVLMGRTPHLSWFGWESRADLEVARKAMADAEIAELADRAITEVSGGERQRAFLAMALAQEPKVLLLDEPTSHLDLHHQVTALSRLDRLRRRDGLAVLAVMHDLNLAAEFCDRIVLMRAGRLLADGPTSQVLTEGRLAELFSEPVRVIENPATGRPHVMLARGRGAGG
ncbi:MAG: ABC transporter ATP-binding protein [Planctomycetes bacterium]|nr:ABC transporter ATP-binding protein [Planctomycetota bacterium]